MSPVEEKNEKYKDQNSDNPEKWNALKFVIDRAELMSAETLDALKVEDLL